MQYTLSIYQRVTVNDIDLHRMLDLMLLILSDDQVKYTEFLTGTFPYKNIQNSCYNHKLECINTHWYVINELLNNLMLLLN